MLVETIASLLAADAAPAPDWLKFLTNFGIFIPIIALYIFLIMGSKRKQDRERKDLLGNLKKGDRVRMVGGELGSIVEVRENEVLVKVDESSNTKIRYVKDAVAQIVEPAGTKPGTAIIDKEKLAEAK